jgi:alpha/beta superfamily hydrolase
MDNKVAQTLARAFVGLGYATARFNFRGVGESEGTYDDGRGEVDDMEIMLDHMSKEYPGLPVALSGFSFGTFVQAQLQQRLKRRAARPSAWCWSAPPPANGRCPGAGGHHPDPRRA